MRKVPLLPIVTCLIFFGIACSDKGPIVASSGDKEFDKTASFILHVVNENKPRFKTPSELAGYLTSTLGLAATIPPSEEFEASAAAHYKGPRPSEKVSYYAKHFTTWETYGQIVLSGNDIEGVVIADAFRGSEEDPFYTWKWKYK